MFLLMIIDEDCDDEGAAAAGLDGAGAGVLYQNMAVAVVVFEFDGSSFCVDVAGSFVATKAK